MKTLVGARGARGTTEARPNGSASCTPTKTE